MAKNMALNVDPAFKAAGKEPGMEIWRIEVFSLHHINLTIVPTIACYAVLLNLLAPHIYCMMITFSHQKLKVVPVEKKSYGKFYSGDSYICLYVRFMSAILHTSGNIGVEWNWAIQQPSPFFSAPTRIHTWTGEVLWILYGIHSIVYHVTPYTPIPVPYDQSADTCVHIMGWLKLVH